jgi:hypothetical protein
MSPERLEELRELWDKAVLSDGEIRELFNEVDRLRVWAEDDEFAYREMGALEERQAIVRYLRSVPQQHLRAFPDQIARHLAASVEAGMHRPLSDT